MTIFFGNKQKKHSVLECFLFISEKISHSLFSTKKMSNVFGFIIMGLICAGLKNAAFLFMGKSAFVFLTMESLGRGKKNFKY